MSRRNTRATNSDEGRQAASGHHEVEVPPVPLASLARAGAISLLVAAIVLVVAILPAEYGIDPTGLGETLGFTAVEVAAQAVSGEEETAISMEFVLQPDEGIEVNHLDGVRAAAG
ncbi:MAG: hypothetical protein KGZ89_00650 [Actinobacteria bacterium]|nr:hypothetical protein [Actinomycetota bacterium]